MINITISTFIVFSPIKLNTKNLSLSHPITEIYGQIKVFIKHLKYI